MSKLKLLILGMLLCAATAFGQAPPSGSCQNNTPQVTITGVGTYGCVKNLWVLVAPIAPLYPVGPILPNVGVPINPCPSVGWRYINTATEVESYCGNDFAWHTPSGSGGGITGPGSATTGYVPLWGDPSGGSLTGGLSPSISINSVFCPLGGTCTISGESGGNTTSTSLVSGNLSVANGANSLIDSGVRETSLIPSFINCAGVDPTDTTDSATGLRACLAANPSGSIYLPPGTYKVNSTVTSTRQQMIVGGQAGGSVLDCTGMTSAACWVVGDTNTSGNGSFARGGMANIAINGPGIGGSKIGLFIGADPAGVISPTGYFGFGTTFRQVIVQQFGTGVEYGNNTWNLTFPGSIICYNSVGILAPGGLSNTGESASFDGSNISNNTVGIQDDGGVLFNFSGTSIDYNGTAITGAWLMANADGAHFEQSTGPLVSFSGNTGFNSFFNSHGSSYVIAAGTGSESGAIVTTSGNTSVLVDGGSARSGHVIAQFINANAGTQLSNPQALPAPMVDFTAYANQPTTNSNGVTQAQWSSLGLTLDHSFYAKADPSSGYGMTINPATSGGSSGSAFGSAIRTGTSNGAGWTVSTANDNSGLRWDFGFCQGVSSDDLCLFNFPNNLPVLRADISTNFIGIGAAGTPPALLSVGSSAQFQVDNSGNVTLHNLTCTGTCPGGGGVTWPATGDLVLSNSTSSPAGIAPINGDCVIGSGGAWVAGSCAGGSFTLPNGVLASRPTSPASPTLYLATDQPLIQQLNTWDGTNWNQLINIDASGLKITAGTLGVDQAIIPCLACANVLPALNKVGGLAGTGSAPAISNGTGTMAVNSGSTNLAGTLTSSTSGTVTFTLTWASLIYAHRAVCTFVDETTNADSVKTTQATAPTATTLTATGTTVTGDIVSYSCSGF